MSSNQILVKIIYRTLFRRLKTYELLFSRLGTNAKTFPVLSSLVGPSFDADTKKLKSFLRTSFKRNKNEKSTTYIDKSVDNAFNSLRNISNEVITLSQMAPSPISNATTNNIVVTIRGEPIFQTETMTGFKYFVMIENNGKNSIQVVGRKWDILEASGGAF
jgi:hypothetical protein